MGAVSQALARFRGNSNYKDYGIRWLLLSAVGSLEKDRNSAGNYSKVGKPGSLLPSI